MAEKNRSLTEKNAARKEGRIADGAKYVAYVSSYTSAQKDKFGIRIYDVDMERGLLIEKDQVEITNSSYLTISHSRQFLYSITDEGVESFRITGGGDLAFIGRASINGMRGSYLSTDYTDRWLFVSGYHDGKITVLRIREDGSVGEITDEVYHKGLGSIAERNFRPHVQCVKMTRDNRFLCACDLGLDNTSVYSFDPVRGKIRHVDTIHSEQESAPRHIKFSPNGRFAYIVHELKNVIDVYRYTLEQNDDPEFEKIQTISTLNDYHASNSAASALNFSEDSRYLISSNAGDNSVVIFRIDQETGLLQRVLCLPVSGDYPKDVEMFPDNRHLVSLNHESNTMTFFRVDLDKGLIVMCAKEMKIDQPNCCIFHRLTEGQQ
ncbi:lactonase family protein [Lachnoclostridium sp. Marseille-P6806]|uniref:lactonase family protein n=1 Tax=Lachnoclostridium sp. Marseille-P6806 TaxID=2364793 RepID=UPI0010306E33|nr:lactonase family protein [Lachnoclostridium sp. Marseille-P6806]